MREVLITSSVLIAALLLLRRIFRNTLSRRVQYALWGLVLVRLLVPVSLPAVDFSVLTAAQPIQETVAARAAPRTAAIPPVLPAAADAPAQDLTASAGEQTQSAADVSALPERSGAAAAPASSAPTLSQVLETVWKAGIALAGLFFLLSNLRFWRRLRRFRRPYPVEGVSRRVYLVEGGVLSSPCLFGLFRPAVYLTPAAVSSEESLRHVLVHEETHARHLDPLWALLRCVCLAVYWFDPLVWIAAACSKTDCELACDEGALARLGEEQRIPYGQTLLSLIPVRKGPANPFAAATTMAARKKQIKNRIARIAHKPRQFAAAAVAAALLAGAVSACTFTGAKVPELPDATGSEDAPEYAASSPSPEPIPPAQTEAAGPTAVPAPPAPEAPEAGGSADSPAVSSDPPAAKTFSAADVEFSDRPLAAEEDPMTYEERLAWAQDRPGFDEDVSSYYISTGNYCAGEDCLAYLGQWSGVPHTDQYSLYLRFSDDTQAHLPLPRATSFGIAKPDRMEFQDGKFIYEIQFPEEAVVDEGMTLIHLAGVYHYEVDLSAGTVSLSIL